MKPLILAAALLVPGSAAVASDGDVDPELRRATVRVADMDAALGFWRDGLGLAVRSDSRLSTAKTRRSMGLPDQAEIRFVTLGRADQQTAMIGLLGVEGAETPALERLPPPQLAAGDLIIVLTADDIAAVRDRAVAAGGMVTTPLEPLTNGSGLEVVLRSPSGVRVQLLQFHADQPFRDCERCPEMVRIAPGRFEMGRNRGEEGRYEGPVRDVTLAEPFALAVRETSNAEFAAFVAATGHETTDICRTNVAGTWTNSPDHSWTDPGMGLTNADELPAVCVSWEDAQAYAGWLSELTGKRYRLPSEAEWEYAAQAGSAADYPWGNDPASACRFANVYDATGAARWGFPWDAAGCDDGFAGPAPVGSFAPDANGLHDMVGNVWEWLQDCHVVPYPPAPVDGSAIEVEGACARRAVRGGSWITRPDRQRPAWRGRDPQDRGFVYFGFRVAREPD